MKTVFRVGMKVYDQIVFPDKEVEVLEIRNDLDYPVRVSSDGKSIFAAYTADGRYAKNLNPTLSTSPYKIKGFEQKSSIPTYDEIIAESLKKGEYVAVLNGIELPDEKMAKAFETLAKLIWLRDYYNEGWQPDWDINKVKYVIKRHGNIRFSNIETTENYPSILYFKSKEIKDKFLEEQKELLEIAKPLL